MRQLFLHATILFTIARPPSAAGTCSSLIRGSQTDRVGGNRDAVVRRAHRSGTNWAVKPPERLQIARGRTLSQCARVWGRYATPCSIHISPRRSFFLVDGCNAESRTRRLNWACGRRATPAVRRRCGGGGGTPFPALRPPRHGNVAVRAPVRARGYGAGRRARCRCVAERATALTARVLHARAGHFIPPHSEWARRQARVPCTTKLPG